MKQAWVDALRHEVADDMVSVGRREITSVSRYLLPENAIRVQQLSDASSGRGNYNSTRVQCVLARDLEFFL